MVIVIGWQVYDIARADDGAEGSRASASGSSASSSSCRLFLLTLVTGWTADRLDRRWIARASVALELGCAAALGWLAWTHATTLLSLYIVAALLGVGRAFAGPALGALAPNLVPREILPRAIALSSIAWQTGAILGPRSAAISTPTRHTRLTPASGVLFAVAFVCLLAIGPVPRPARARPEPVGADGRRPALCPPQPARARRDQPRPVRGPARRSDRDASGLRARRAPRRPGGPRPPPRRARCRRDPDRGVLLGAAAQAQCRRRRCWPRSACSARRRSSSAFRARCRCRSPASRCSAPPTCSRSMCASR